MANNNNENVSINVEINAGGQQQLNQYKNAFDGLRTSIANLSTPINKLGNDISKLNDSINQAKIQNDSIVDSTIKVGNAFEALQTIYRSVGNVVKLLKIGSSELTAAMTGGLSIIIAFLPEIIELTKSFFKGNESISTMAQNFKNLNEVMKSANKDAAEQTTKLDVLYKSATNANNAQADRLKYAQQLKETYPEQFKNFDKEQIANGKAKTAYSDLAKSILASAKAKAALNKMSEETAKLLEADYQIEKIQNANYNEKKKRTEELTHGILGGYRGAGAKQILERDKKDSDDRAKTSIELVNAEKRKIQARLDYLMKFAKDADEFKTKVSSSAATISNSVNISYSDTGTVNKKRKKPAAKTDNDIKPRESVQFEDVRPDTSAVKTSLDKSVEQSLDAQKNVLLNKTIETQRIITGIEVKSAKERAEAEEQSVKSKIHSGDKFIDAALKNSKKDSTIFKAAFLAKKATSIADTVISTKQAVMESFKAYAGIPFIGQALGIAQAIFMGAQGASSIAEIAKQKPGFAEGGQFRSDGKGALLPGYSRTDNTNAYLRSGEAVVVSEAMRNPWARNLVSAINVAHGGRDFSVTNPGRGYAIGGIFTDGGNSNRYYNQPMNDVKDLANTLAYQMINNFPPVYVDVKDINSQQSILAQTVNRVNL
jgi:hypothetical protein